MAPSCRNGRLLEHADTRRLIATGVVVVGVAAAAWFVAGRIRAPEQTVIPGDGAHPVVVEVLNGTDVDGLAREVARRLRRQGIDVVYFGSGNRTDLDSTRIMIRRGDTTVARPIREALGLGRVASELDPSLLLDASVIVGRDLAPVPSQGRRP